MTGLPKTFKFRHVILFLTLGIQNLIQLGEYYQQLAVHLASMKFLSLSLTMSVLLSSSHFGTFMVTQLPLKSMYAI